MLPKSDVVSVAVYVTSCPKGDGLADEATEIETGDGRADAGAVQASAAKGMHTPPTRAGHLLNRRFRVLCIAGLLA